MSKKMSDLERAIGGKLQRKGEQVIPGLTPSEDIWTVYYCAPEGKSARKLFNQITTFTDPPFAQFGGVFEAGCKVTVPTGQCFIAIQAHGDIPGWQADVRAGANATGVDLAEIESGHLVVGETRVSLDNCQIEFT